MVMANEGKDMKGAGGKLDGKGVSSAVRDEVDDGLIMIRMEINEPLDTLKAILEESLPGISNHKFTLQDGPELDGSKSLVHHGVQGEGEVVINLELRDDERGKRLDIVDVLKPADDELTELNETDVQPQEEGAAYYHGRPTDAQTYASGPSAQLRVKKPRQRRKKPVASRNDSMKMEQPKNSVPKTPPKPDPTQFPPADRNSASQIQLWQFLLELLTDHVHLNSIQWLGKDGEFKLIDPEMVARLWGLRKNKPHMNYEKLSRALRYYYDGDMIAKVTGQSFVFKFICDLKFMIGYSASELNAFVHEAAAAAKNNSGLLMSERSQPFLVASDYN